MFKQVLHVDSALKSSPIGRWREFSAVLPVCSKQVVLLAFLRVAEHLIGFLDLFELFFGLLVLGIQVGMILPGELPV